MLGGLSVFFSRRCRGLRSCVESVQEPEDSSPVFTWNLGYFWSLPRGVSPRLEWGHARALSSRAVAVVLLFPSRGSRDLWLSLRLSHVAFPRGSSTGLSFVPPWCESIFGLKVEAVQGKQVSLQWTETSGRLWEWWLTLAFLSPFLRRALPLEMLRKRREFFHDHAGEGSLLSI